MLRYLSLLAVSSVVFALLSPASAVHADPLLDAPGSLQSPASTPHVLRDAEVQPVVPDHAVENNGTRVELYTSSGDVDVSADWRAVNAYAYLVASVPKYKHVYTTMYNTLWDNRSVRHNKSKNKWELVGVGANDLVFGPTAAFLKLINQYDVNKGEQRTYVGVLGNRPSINTAVKQNSSLATLVKQATRYFDCNKGGGACLTPRSGENHMHAKYAIFEQTKDSEGRLWDNVVWITSANLNGASGGKKSNVSIAIYGDQKAYDDMKSAVWHAMATKKFTAPYLQLMRTGSQPGPAGITLLPSPRTQHKDWTDAPDFEANFLRSQVGLAKTDCRIYAIHSLFSRTEIRDVLATLNNDCDVKILLGLNALSDVANFYFSNSAELRYLIDSVEFANVHDKTLTMTYTRNGTNYGTTFGGSANFNTTSLQYEELVFRSDNLGLSQATERHAERLYRLAKGADHATPVTSVSLNPEDPVLVAGASINLVAQIAPAKASVKTVTWASDNHAVATIDTDGTVTAHAPGEATISVLTVSGAKTASVNLTVVAEEDPEQPTTPTPQVPTQALVVTTGPELTMHPYQSPAGIGIENGDTPVTVTWSQGDVSLNGKVTLQYYSGGWKNYDTLTLVDGRATARYEFKNSHTWRAVASGTPTAANGAQVSLTSGGSVTKDYSHVVVRKYTSTDVMRVYAPPLIMSKKNVPYLFSWRNPYVGRKGIVNEVRLQYKKGSKWSTAKTFAIPNGDVTLKATYPATNTRQWRIASGTKAVPKGTKALVSKPVKITTVK